MSGRSIRAVAAVFLAVAIGFFYGVVAVHAKLWPYGPIAEAANYLFSERFTTISARQRLENDFGGTPHRFLVSYEPETRADYRPITAPIFDSTRAAPVIRTDGSNAQQGFIAILGAMAFKGNLHGALLIDYRGRIVHHWPISQEGLSWDHPSDRRVFPHGFHVRPDGDIIVAFDHGASLSRYDACGGAVWHRKGTYHHSAVPAEDGTAWTWRDSKLVRFDTKTGADVRVYDLEEVRAANPETDVLGIRQVDHYPAAGWADDPLHPNDVEPLPAALAPAFPQFEAGDLLISLRSLNLLFVMDPQTQKIKWWRMGQTRRQHDPDWQPDGTITVFDNQMHRDHSRILSIDPQSYAVRTIVDGARFGFHSNVRGRHQVKADGNVLIVSSQQGRILEVTPEGEVAFEFLNRYDADNDRQMLVMNAIHLPADYFDEEAFGPCEAQS